MFFGARFFGPRYWGGRYWGTQADQGGTYFGSSYWGSKYFGPHYWSTQEGEAEAGRNIGTVTRLAQIGIGAQRYQTFEAKAAAQPAEEFIGLPAISPPIVVGDGFGVLPRLRGDARGVHGVAGEALLLLRLVGNAVGKVGAGGTASAKLAALDATAVGAHGPVGEARGSLPSLAAASAGSVVTNGEAVAVVATLKGIATGRHEDPDDEEAIIAMLLAA